MNGADSSDDENGVLYFLPGGIADDSPPRRTLGMSSPVPSSFGYIGAAQSSTTTTQNFRMTPVASTEPNNSLLSGLGGVAVPNKPAARDRPLGGGGFGSFGGYGYGGRFGGSPGESSTPANGGGVGSIGSSSFLGPNTNAGASSSQPIQTPSSSTFARSPFMSTTTSSSGGPLRAPPGLDIPLPSAAGSSFLQPQHRMLDRKDESLRAALGFLQHSSPAPTTHLEQPPPATASNMFGRSGYQQSNKDLAELNTTSVVVVQKPPSRLHLEDQHDYATGSSSIGVHRFRNTFLEPPPSDDLGTSSSSHPPPYYYDDDEYPSNGYKGKSSAAGSSSFDEPIAAPVLEVEGEGPTAPDESTDGDEMVSQDGRGDDDPSSIPAVANKASNVEDDNVCVGRDDSDEDGSAQDNVSTSADTSPSSSPREERLKTHDDAATPDDLPPLEEDVMTPGPSPIACHDDSSDKPEVVASATPPQPQEFHPPSSEDDMPARPPSSSKKRSDKKSRRTTSSSHKKQDPHGKNDADGSGAHPTGSPPPQRTPDDDDDDDDLFAPVPRSAWSVAKSAVVSTCVWLVAFSGASTGLPWLIVHAHWLASTLLSLAFHCGFHVLSFGLKFHRFVVRGLIFNRNIASCFAFLYLFPLLVQYVIPWAPPWAPVCLWYAFLVQLFCTQGSTAMVATFRIVLPLVFLVEGVSHHSFLLDLNGAELLLISFILSAVKTGNLYSPVFFLSMSLQCLSAVFLGSEMFVQWIQLAVALYSLHAMASDEWGDVEDNTTSFSQSSSPFLGSDVHHPSGTSIQKTKRLDRRSMAAVVKGRKPRAASST
ncbi:hypothetical protein AaE_005701 [Aphanomyces astaci]|uniref:Uncharacterized protein n=1 Tax=Aphanomyces astaci TaxID=112090 RepID=A0A6A5AEW9_APHAT|nr:hypothetical protein AaE_005701 [Aphanomyces astaci]